MANYTLHLGFNWNSPLIGSIWGDGALSDEYRFLQYALANDADKPAWFQFKIGDVLSVMIWDLTSSPSVKDLMLSMSFAALEAGETSTYDPGTLVTSSAAESLQSDDGHWYLRFTSVDGAVTTSGTTGPWGDSRFVYTAGPLTFSANSNYKLAFSLRVVNPNNGNARVFISDPEVIVGSRGD